MNTETETETETNEGAKPEKGEKTELMTLEDYEAAVRQCRNRLLVLAGGMGSARDLRCNDGSRVPPRGLEVAIWATTKAAQIADLAGDALAGCHPEDGWATTKAAQIADLAGDALAGCHPEDGRAASLIQLMEKMALARASAGR